MATKRTAKSRPLRSRGSARKQLSIRIAPELEKFLREKGSEYPTGFNGVAEDCLEIGAVAHGYQPPSLSDSFVAFAEMVSKLTVERMKEEGLVAKGDAE